MHIWSEYQMAFHESNILMIGVEGNLPNNSETFFFVCFFQGTSERLTMHLVEEHSVVDPTYIEDFLLTYRTFLPSPMVVGKKLLEWFHDPSLRDKVHRHSYAST